MFLRSYKVLRFWFRDMHRHEAVCYSAPNKIFASPILTVVQSHSPEWPKRGSENGGVAPPTVALVNRRSWFAYKTVRRMDMLRMLSSSVSRYLCNGTVFGVSIIAIGMFLLSSALSVVPLCPLLLNGTTIIHVYIPFMFLSYSFTLSSVFYAMSPSTPPVPSPSARPPVNSLRYSPHPGGTGDRMTEP
ncbi:unnamed protein product [Laminaria digitata]